MFDDTKIDKFSIKHAYIQVADAVAARIEDGRCPIKLPSERTLAEEFHVSYITARHAIAILRERGLIVSIHGRGTFVAPGHRTDLESVSKSAHVSQRPPDTRACGGDSTI